MNKIDKQLKKYLEKKEKETPEIKGDKNYYTRMKKNLGK